MVDTILQGFSLALSLETFGALSAGILLGMFVGAVPGLTIMMALVILLPVAFFFPPLIGIPFLLGIFKGGYYGGGIPAVLLSIPGTAAAIPTCIDGHPLSLKGQARKALDMVLYSSVIGDTISNILTLLCIGPIAVIALKLGPPEMVTIVLLAFVVVSTVSRGAVVKGLIMAFVGLFFSMIGQDPLGFMSRFTFGSFELRAGIPLVPMLIGAFAVPEVLMTVEKGAADYLSKKMELSNLGQRLKFSEFRRCVRTILRSTAIGFGVGICPGIGGVVAAFTGYALAKKSSKHPETFGTGELEGVAACEAADNATNGPELIPLLTLGIPGDSATALLFGAFMAQGIRPGPQLMQEQGPLIYGILISMVIGNILFLIMGYFTMPLWARVIQVNRALLLPMISVIAFGAAYMFRSNPFDLLIVVFFGIFGYFARKFHFDMGPMVMGFLLGPIIEFSLGQTLNMADGNLFHWILFNRPIATGIFMVIPLLGIWSLLKGVRQRRKGDRSRLPMKGGA